MGRKKKPPKLKSNPLFDLEDDPGKVFEEFLAAEGEILPKDEANNLESQGKRNHPPKKQEKSTYSIDLHGMTRVQVRDILAATIAKLKSKGQGPHILRVITAKADTAGTKGLLLQMKPMDF